MVFFRFFNDFVGCADFWSLFYWFSNVSHRSFNDFMDYLMIFSDLLDVQSIWVDFYSMFRYCLSIINGFSMICQLKFHWIYKWFHCLSIDVPVFSKMSIYFQLVSFVSLMFTHLSLMLNWLGINLSMFPLIYKWFCRCPLFFNKL